MLPDEKLVELLFELQSLPKESELVEFKLNNSNLQEIGEYISALSNSACYHKKEYGFLVYGVENDTHKLVGTDFYAKATKKGNEELENWLAIQLNPRIDFNVFELDYEKMHFVIFRVQAAKNMPVSFNGEQYIRIGSYKKKLYDHPERERNIWHIEKQLIFENLPAFENAAADDVIRLLDCPNFFRLFNLPIPDTTQGIIDRFLQEKIIEKNKDKYIIKNIGALLFAHNLEDFDDLVRKSIRVIFYEGSNKYKTIKEKTDNKGYAVGFEEIIKYLDGSLPTKETINNGLRENDPDYPIIAVRELIANAIIHQDFSITGTSPMVEIFDNRIEITNPGKPLIDHLRFVDHNPESRNELLARFMRRLNICEERGSGFDKVVIECEKNHLPAPEIFIAERYTRVILYRNKTLKQMNQQDKIRSCYLHACLRYVSGDFMTNKSLRERFSIEAHNYTKASKIISDTMNIGLIKGFDEDSKSRKFAMYVPFWH
ncbi:MAG: putative DNA binding domain-containing protein [Candidatus Cloacimonetes bacterium]|nr:putative DNA binding domain-containing protein [Candidatus Cloacimonadota bacterium]